MKNPGVLDEMTEMGKALSAEPGRCGDSGYSSIVLEPDLHLIPRIIHTGAAKIFSPGKLPLDRLPGSLRENPRDDVRLHVERHLGPASERSALIEAVDRDLAHRHLKESSNLALGQMGTLVL